MKHTGCCHRALIGLTRLIPNVIIIIIIALLDHFPATIKFTELQFIPTFAEKSK